MSILEFLSTYIGNNPVQDADPVTDSQPDVSNETAQDALDGDEARASQLNTLKYKLQAVCKIAGDSINGPVGSLCDILARDHANGDATQLRLRERATDPTNASAVGFIIAKNVGGVTELFFVDSTGAATQISTSGKLAITETAGPTILPFGDVLDGQLLARSGATIVGETKRNLTAVVAPTVTDDDSADYSVGSMWIDTVTDKAYICFDASTGAAVWTDITGAGGGASSPLTTKGDLWGYDTDDQRIPVGSVGQVLTPDPNEALGVKWAALSSVLEGAAGVDAFEDVLSATQTIVASSYSPIPNTPVSVTVNAEAGETVLIGFAGAWTISSGTAYFTVYVDGVSTNKIQRGNSQFNTVSDTFPFTFTTDGDHTIELYAQAISGSFTAVADWCYVRAVKLRGGFINPENIPLLSYSTASTVNVIPAPGAVSTFKARLNDGTRYKATGPLSVDLTVSGLGGLDTGSEANSTWYYVYLVPSATAGVMDVVASATDPDGGGPTGYSIYRYIGSFYNDSSGDIREFFQVGNRFYQYSNPGLTPSTTPFTAAVLDISDYVPVTADAGIFQLKLDNGVSGDGHQYWISPEPTASLTHVQTLGVASTTVMLHTEIPIITAQTIYHRLVQVLGGSSDPANFVELNVHAFIDGHLRGEEEIRAQAAPDSTTLWRYLDTTNLPAGASSPEAVWQFDGTGSQLSDRTANGHDCTVEGGTLLQTAREGLVGLGNQDSYRLSVALPAGLRTTGAVTCVALMAADNVAGEDSSIISLSEVQTLSGSIYNGNYLFVIEPDTMKPYAVHEYGAASSFETPVFDSMLMPGPLHHVTFTRSSDGLTYKIYIDGQLLDTKTVVNAPDGGSSNVAYIMGGTSGANWVNSYRGALFSLLVTKEEWSAAQVLESYQYCRKLIVP